MQNNEVLRSLGHAFSMSPERLSELFALGGLELSAEQAERLALRERDEAHLPCSDEQLAALLDGFVLDRRGPPPNGRRPNQLPLTNNAVFKKLRAGLQLREEGILKLLAAGGLSMDKRQLTPLFRAVGHKHYKSCSDEVLRAFFRGLAGAQWG